MTPPRFIENLRLADFRSYRALDVGFDGRPVVLFGENGAGKTNLLEAISLLSPGRGLRRAKIAELTRKTDITAPDNTLLWAVAARLGGETPLKLGTGQQGENPTRRTTRIDGSPASASDLAEHLTLNWLTPAQDKLFSGPPSDRRKFLDRLCMAHFPAHGKYALAYEKARAERGRLLADKTDDPIWYDALEKDMASFGAKIAQARTKTLAKLQEQITARDASAFPKSTVVLDGETENYIAGGATLSQATDFLEAIFRDNRPLDFRAGRSLRGVHKTEILVTHLTKNMPARDCSTGEQKALLIGLILAHAHAQANWVGEDAAVSHPPILLLDEVAAHLDEHRRAALVEELLALKTQVFMTGTDAHLFHAFEDRAQMFKVENAKLHLQ